MEVSNNEDGLETARSHITKYQLSRTDRNIQLNLIAEITLELNYLHINQCTDERYGRRKKTELKAIITNVMEKKKIIETAQKILLLKIFLPTVE